MAKIGEVAHVEFIKDFLRKGEKRKTILARFSEKWQKVSTRVFDCRLKEAKAQFQIETKQIETETSISVQKEIESRKSKILTVIERKEILTQIAKGEIPLKKPMICDGVIQLIKVVPDWMDRKNAIAELNKMDGDYAATKTDITTTGKELNVVPVIIRNIIKK